MTSIGLSKFATWFYLADPKGNILGSSMAIPSGIPVPASIWELPIISLQGSLKSSFEKSSKVEGFLHLNDSTIVSMELERLPIHTPEFNGFIYLGVMDTKEDIVPLKSELLQSESLELKIEQAVLKYIKNGTLASYLAIQWGIKESILPKDMFDLELAIFNRLQAKIKELGIVHKVVEHEICLLIDKMSSIEEITSICKMLVKFLAMSYSINGLELFPEIKIGVSVLGVDAETSEDLIGNATLAVSSLETENTSTFKFYSPFLVDRAYHQYKIEQALKEALEHKELYLVYQPQIDLETNMLSGCEALVRWNSATLGFVSPGDFIPIAEKSTLILEIGDYVTKEAARQLQIWSKEKVVPKIGVNLSLRQAENKEFIPFLNQVMQEHNINPAQLELELTESSIIKVKDSLLKTLDRLLAMKVPVAVDDFGSGHAGFQYLKTIPADKIKIDQEFIKNLENSEPDQFVVKAIIDVAHGLGKKVVAEGVETIEQARILKGLKCDIGQGYLWGKPLKVDEFEVFKNTITLD